MFIGIIINVIKFAMVIVILLLPLSLHHLFHYHHNSIESDPDPYDLLARWEQVTVFRLRIGHNRLNYHLYSNFCICHTEQCPCGTGSQTTEHLMQSCPLYELLRKAIWPDHTPIACNLYGSLGNLRCTTIFEETGASI